MPAVLKRCLESMRDHEALPLHVLLAWGSPPAHFPFKACLLCSARHGIDLRTPEARRRRLMTLYSGHFALEQARPLGCQGICSWMSGSNYIASAPGTDTNENTVRLVGSSL